MSVHGHPLISRWHDGRVDIFRSVMCGGSYYFLGLGLMRGFILFALLVFPLYAWGKSCGDGGPVGGGHYPHQGQAYEAAVKKANFHDCLMRENKSNIEHHPRDSLYAVRVPGAIAGYYYYDDTCESRSSRITPRYPVTGSLGCNSGCLVSFIRNGDDETTTESTTGEVCDGDKLKEMCESKSGGNANYVYVPGMRVCHPVQPECPEGQQPKHGVCEPLDACPHGTITDKKHRNVFLKRKRVLSVRCVLPMEVAQGIRKRMSVLLDKLAALMGHARQMLIMMVSPMMSRILRRKIKIRIRIRIRGRLFLEVSDAMCRPSVPVIR